MDDLVKIESEIKIRVNDRISNRYAREKYIKVGDTGRLYESGFLPDGTVCRIHLDKDNQIVFLYPTEFDIIEDYTVELL